MYVSLREIPYGLAVRIPGFHLDGPGSTPGMGTHFLSVQTMILSITQASLVESIKLKSSFSTTLLRKLLNELRFRLDSEENLVVTD